MDTFDMDGMSPQPATEEIPITQPDPVSDFTPQQPAETVAPAVEAPVYTPPLQQPYAPPIYKETVQTRPVYTPPVPTQVVYGYESVTNKPKKEKKSSGMWWKIPLCIILAILIAGGSSFATIWYMNHYGTQPKAVEGEASPDTTRLDELENKLKAQENKLDVAIKDGATQPGNQQPVNPEAPAPEGLNPAAVYSKNVGAVVAIANEGVSTNIYGQTSRTASSGSGFIISADGYVVSNYHVVQGAEKLTVILSDGTEYEAKLIGSDDTNDVSLLKIEATDLPYTVLGNSADLVVGDQVCAIGNPLGELTSTLTVGYVSAIDRQITTEGGAMNMIQTDAAINSGNSGGPLFNTKGEVIGINTAKYSGTSTSGATIEGIGFAIPIDDVKDILTDLQEFGYVNSAYLGVEVRDVDESGVSYGLPEGAFVQSVVDGYAAQRAGVQAQDIIVNLGGYDIYSVSDLLKALRRVEVGQETTITVFRAGANVDLKIIPEAKPQA